METRKYQFAFQLHTKEGRKNFLLDTVIGEHGGFQYGNGYAMSGNLYNLDTGEFIYDFSVDLRYDIDFSIEQAEAYAKKYIENNWSGEKGSTKAENITKIPESCQNKFIFTFGSAEQFPFHLGEYIVIEARNEKEARDMFKVLYPNPRNKDTLNCAFVYENAEFEELRKTYGDFKVTPERLYVTDAYKTALYLEQAYELLDKAQETMSFQCNEKGMDEIGELMGNLDNLMDDYVTVHNPDYEKEEDDLER